MCVYIIYTYMRYVNPGAMATEVAFAKRDLLEPLPYGDPPVQFKTTGCKKSNLGQLHKCALLKRRKKHMEPLTKKGRTYLVGELGACNRKQVVAITHGSHRRVSFVENLHNPW